MLRCRRQRRTASRLPEAFPTRACLCFVYHGVEEAGRGAPAELDQALANIAVVPLPVADPVSGPDDGQLTELWRQ